MVPPLKFPPALLVALVGAVMTGFSWAPWGLWPGAILGVALLSIALRGRRTRSALAIGFAAGVVINAISIGWIGVLGWYVGVTLVMFMSLWTMLLGWVVARVQTLPLWPLWVACAWTAAEFGAANVPFGGFGWNRLAYTTADQPLSGYLSLVGASGVSLLVALAGALLAAAFVGSRARWVAFLLAAALFVGGGAAKLLPNPPGEGSIKIGIVQGNVDGIGHGAAGYARSVTNNHLSETISLLAQARTGLTAMPDFVLWPENSSDIDPTKDAETRRLVELSVALADRPVFVGAVMLGPGADERQTTGLWWDPDSGLGPRYDKRNLVPFGEWIPFRDVLLPRLPILQQIGRQGVPGTEPGVLTVSVPGHGKLRIGDIICFELAYDTTVYDTLRHGAQVLVVQSNNATYTFTPQPHQQFAMTRIRAMEARRELAIATTSSFSGLVRSDGSVALRTDEARAASAVVSVPLRSGVTLGVLAAPWVSWVATVLAVATLTAAVVLERRARMSR